MRFSISEYLGFSDKNVLEELKREGVSLQPTIKIKRQRIVRKPLEYHKIKKEEQVLNN